MAILFIVLIKKMALIIGLSEFAEEKFCRSETLAANSIRNFIIKLSLTVPPVTEKKL